MYKLCLPEIMVLFPDDLAKEYEGQHITESTFSCNKFKIRLEEFYKNKIIIYDNGKKPFVHKNVTDWFTKRQILFLYKRDYKQIKKITL